MQENELIKNVKKYQEMREDYVFESIISFFHPCINKQTNKIDKFYEDDVKQEIINKIYFAIINFNISCDYSKINKEKGESKFLKFQKRFLKNNENKKVSLKELEYEYLLSICQYQFIKYIKKICINERISFFKKIIKKQNNEISLNALKSNNVLLTDLVMKDSKEIDDKKLKKLSKSDLIFLESFYDEGKLLKCKEVAKKLNITPQAISMRKKRIIKKIKKMWIFSYFGVFNIERKIKEEVLWK